MKDGFIRVAAGSVNTVVADTKWNAEEIKHRIQEADQAGVNLLVLPELCLTGYSCGDLFYSQVLQQGALDALKDICDYSSGKYPLVILGLPLLLGGKLYNCAAAIYDGHVLAIVPKTHLPNYGEFYELRQFTSGQGLPNTQIQLGGMSVPFGTNLLLCHETLEHYCIGIELCEDLWAPAPPSQALTAAGATIIANLSASDETIGKADYRRMLVASTSARLLCGYIYANAGPGESSQDLVFSQQHLIAENGTLLAENPPFGDCPLLISQLDVARLTGERHRQTSFATQAGSYTAVPFAQPLRKTVLTRHIDKNPFVPAGNDQIAARAEAILQMQAQGLKKRLSHIHAKTAVLGISGGLDSCLALLVAVRAFDLLQKPRSGILAVTMPCFGTTARTKDNAEELCRQLGVTLRTVPIAAAVRQHFADIGHDEGCHDVTYENAQARERTQVIMDIANQEGGLVIGTGDLSELALGWATYNGDHMSMYGVNASVPKTLVRYIVRYEAGRSPKALADVLYDILDTPVSPELLPADQNGAIAQKTEDLVGPYELHDFFLYYLLRFGFSPAKIFRLAQYAFGSDYDKETILHWLQIFVRRFFAQQFKRSCMPDGPKVGSAALSPRGDWRMPSDASARLWLDTLEGL